MSDVPTLGHQAVFERDVVETQFALRVLLMFFLLATVKPELLEELLHSLHLISKLGRTWALSYGTLVVLLGQ